MLLHYLVTFAKNYPLKETKETIKPILQTLNQFVHVLLKVVRDLRASTKVVTQSGKNKSPYTRLPNNNSNLFYLRGGGTNTRHFTTRRACYSYLYR
jgi:hypothetical protein